MRALLSFVMSKQVVAAVAGLCIIVLASNWLSGTQEDNPFDNTSIWDTGKEQPGSIESLVDDPVLPGTLPFPPVPPADSDLDSQTSAPDSQTPAPDSQLTEPELDLSIHDDSISEVAEPSIDWTDEKPIEVGNELVGDQDTLEAPILDVPTAEPSEPIAPPAVETPEPQIGELTEPAETGQETEDVSLLDSNPAETLDASKDELLSLAKEAEETEAPGLNTVEGDVWAAPVTSSRGQNNYPPQLHQDGSDNSWRMTSPADPLPKQPGLQQESLTDGYQPFAAGNPAIGNNRSNGMISIPPNPVSPGQLVSPPVPVEGPHQLNPTINNLNAGQRTIVMPSPGYVQTEPQAAMNQRSIIQSPIIEQPVQQTIIREQVRPHSVLQRPVTQQPVTQQPVVQRPVVQQQAIQQVAVRQAVNQRPILQRPSRFVNNTPAIGGFVDPSPLRFRFGLEGLFFSRGKGADDQDFVFDANTYAPVLKHSDLNSATDAAARMTLYFDTVGGTGFELSYFHFDQFLGTQNLSDVIPVFFGGSPLYASPSYDFNYATSLKNIEFNAWRRTSQRLRYGYGIRSVSLDENFDTLESGGGGGFTAGGVGGFFSDTQNEMLGGQFLLGLNRYLGRGMNLEFGTKFALLANNADIHFSSATRDIEFSDSNLATLVDLNVGVATQLTQNMAFRIGYQTMLLGGVALAPNQSTGFNYSATSADGKFSNVSFSGLYFGCSARF